MLKHTVFWIATSEVVRKLRNIYKRHSLDSIFHISLKHKLPLLLPSTVWKQETGLTFRWIATSEVVRKLRNIYKRHSLDSIFHISLKHKLPLLLPSTVWKQETGLTFRCSQLNKRKRNLAVTNKCDYIQFTITNIYCVSGANHVSVL